MQQKYKIAPIVLAAGKGVRMKSSVPKVMHELACKPLIEYVLEVAYSVSDLVHVVVNDSIKSNEGFAKLLSKYNAKMCMQIGNGTAAAVYSCFNACDITDDLILILYGDTPLIDEKVVNGLVKGIKAGSDLSLVGFLSDNPYGYGRLICENGNVVDIIEQADLKEEQKQIKLCNAGIMLIKKDILRDFIDSLNINPKVIDEYYLTDVARYATQKNCKISYYVEDENKVVGINDLPQLINADLFLQKLIVQNAYQNGVKVIKPETSYFSSSVIWDEDVTVFPNVFVGNDVVFEKNVVVNSFSYIEGAVIKEGSVLGPFVRIRSNSVVGDRSKIGNFVEVKNAILGKGVKAAHLSYVGDVKVDDLVNIGAGTVFCNYDGVRKHQSVVGSGVFIGANSSIISPIKIGKGSKIAAGTVVTKDVQNDELSISRVPQKNLPYKKK